MIDETDYGKPGPEPLTVDDAFRESVMRFTKRDLASLFAYLSGAAGGERTQWALNHLHAVQRAAHRGRPDANGAARS